MVPTKKTKKTKGGRAASRWQPFIDKKGSWFNTAAISPLPQAWFADAASSAVWPLFTNLSREHRMEQHKQILCALQADLSLCCAEPAALEELAGKAGRLCFDKGEYVFRAGDATTHFYLVESGLVILSKESASGKAFTYMVATPGIPLNAITCFRPSPRIFSALVAVTASVIAIPAGEFRQWVLANPPVANNILSTMGDLLDGAYTRILDLVDESVETRILNVLSMLSSRLGVELPLTNTDLAEMVGTSRESAARVISRLQQIGVLSKLRGSISIVDVKQLESMAPGPFFMI